MKAKVLIVIAARSVTGPAKGVFQFLEYLDHRDAECYLYAFRSNGIRPKLLLDRAEILKIPVNLFDQNKKAYFSLIRQAIKEAKKNNISIIQTHGFKPSVLGFFVQLFCDVKWICFLHGTTSENFKVKFFYLIENIVQVFSARTILVSEAQRCKIFKGYDRTRVRVLHNAIDTEKPVPLSRPRVHVRKSLNIPDNCRLLVFVGRFSPEKGLDIFLKSLSLLSMKDSHIRAIFIGDGPERDRLEKQSKELHLDDMTHFVGFTKTPGDYMLEADAIVVPSRSEGIPNAVLEAMSLGKPVIATAVGGVPEIIEDGVNGYLVPSERPDRLAEAIETILKSPDMYRRFVTNGKKRMKSSFSIKKRVTKLISIYQEVLNGYI